LNGFKQQQKTNKNHYREKRAFDKVMMHHLIWWSKAHSITGTANLLHK
jgi:hypothetical protein